MAEGFAMCEAIWDVEGRLCDYTILEMNSALQRMLGVGAEAVGTKLSEGAGYSAEWLKLCDRVLKTGAPSSFEMHTGSLDLWHEIRVTRVTERKMAQIFFDITERKRAELRQASLFDELNHRVSNNLMLVSGILQMKARETDSPAARDQLQKAVSRVQSIAQVHRALYRGARTDVVDFGAYLQELCEGVRSTLVHDERIQIEVEQEPVPVPVDMAIPLGMVVNELVTNAVKYAYPFPLGGVISVSAVRDGDALRLTVRDVGVGLPDDIERRPGGGLGMKLIKSLVAQVSGELTRLAPPGAGFEVRTPLP
jgi:two-component sensor histidine kinase